MNIKTTRIMLITASTLFTGCVSEVVEAIVPSLGDNNTTKELNETSTIQSNFNSKKENTTTKVKGKMKDKIKKIDIGIEKKIDGVLGEIFD